jgi:uncharacterized protein with HEPN domain
MRDNIAHGYFGINMEIVWEIVKQDLPRLIDVAERMLADYQPPNSWSVETA